MHHSRWQTMEPEVSRKCYRSAIHRFKGLRFSSDENNEEIYGGAPESIQSTLHPAAKIGSYYNEKCLKTNMKIIERTFQGQNPFWFVS